MSCCCPCPDCLPFHPQPDMGYASSFLGRNNQAAALADLAQRCGSEARAIATSASFAGAANALADEFDRIVAELQ